MEYEDMVVGSLIPPLTEKITPVQTVMYCGITWDFARQHYDSEFARRLGFKQPVVDPQMYGAFLGKMLTAWVKTEGRIKRLSMRYIHPSFIGDSLTYKGQVVKKRIKETEKRLDCDLEVVNQNGVQVVKGTAVILLFQ